MNERAIFDDDPTGLSDVRDGLERELTRRWTTTAREVKRAILQNDALSIGDKAPRLAMPVSDKAQLFRRWLDERLMSGVAGYDGSWLEPHLGQASKRGVRRVVIGDAQQGLDFLVTSRPPSARACHAASVDSLATICEQTSELAHGAVAAGLLQRARPGRIAKLVDQAFGHGLKRTRQLAEHAVTQAYSQATLDALEASGVTHVGTLSRAKSVVRSARFARDASILLDADDDEVIVERDDGARFRVVKRGDQWLVLAMDFDPGEPRDEQGKWTAGSTHGAGYEFVSPNVGALGFSEANAALQSHREGMLLEASSDVDRAVGAFGVTSAVIGAWADGAEHSTMTVIDHADWDTLRLAAAIKGHLADQKQVLIFKEAGEGEKATAALYSFDAKGDLGQIHQRLLDDGVAFHTLQPMSDGATVWIADTERSVDTMGVVQKAAHGAHIDVRDGQAEFLGTSQDTGTDREQRDDARRAYEGLIAKSAVPGAASIWQGLHHRWGQALAQVADALYWFADAARKNPQPQHPRSGQFAKAHVVAREMRRSKRTGRFGKQGLDPVEQRKEELTEARFGRVIGRLDVQTQGDDRVCDVCDEISANGPYGVNEARSLIPAHPNCRCLFVAAGTMQDAYDPDQPRDESGKWTAVFVHGGRDFGAIDPAKYGSGERGGIRPLGGGLYGGVALSPDDLETAVELAKVYGAKYGGFVHAFGLHVDDPNIAKIGYGGDKWSRGGLGAETAHRRIGGGLAKQVEYEVLPWKSGGRHGVEAAVHDPAILSRLGKWPAATPTAEIVRQLRGGGLKDFDPDEPRNEKGEWSSGAEGITAYHGSPHDFSRFDLAHMGQGEGTQVYGHGLYLAEEPEVARSYKSHAGGPGGHLYSVRVHAKPEEFLDWDKPLSQQSKLVQDYVSGRELGGTLPPALAQRPNAMHWDPTGEQMMQGFIGMGPKGAARLAAAGIKGVRYLDQESRNKARAPYWTLRRGDTAVRQITNKERAEAALVEARQGYPEGGWRLEGPIDNRTHNYVVADPSILEITHKNGVPLTKAEAKDALVELTDFWWSSEPRDEKGEWTSGGSFTAYHGSGHEFDKFDASKIGTGQGAQTYGYGLYLAREPKVATTYEREGIDENQDGIKFPDGRIVRQKDMPDAESVAWQMIAQGSDKSVEGGITLTKHLIESTAQKDSYFTSIRQRSLGILQKWEDQGAETTVQKGHLYTVQVHADPDSFLDLDKAIASQGKVGAAVRSVLPDQERDKPHTGQTAFEAITNNRREALGRTKAEKAAADELAAAGIKGVKYLDELSRDVKAGTHNYVVFDPSLLEVTHRNGKRLSASEARDAWLADFSADEPRDPKGRWTALSGSEGHQALISTRPVTATGVGAEAKAEAAAAKDVYKTIDMAAMKAAPEQFKANTALFKDAKFYPGMRADEVKGGADEVAKSVKDRMVDNLVFLANKVQNGDFGSKDDFKRWAGWYEGAHKIADGNAKKYKTDIATASGVIAALSPQNDWNGNVYQADVVMDAMANKQGMGWDKAMRDKSQAIWHGQRLAMAREIEGKTLAELDQPMAGDPEGEEGRSLRLARKGMWIRTENEAHSTREHRQVNPEGTFGEVMKTKAGLPTPAKWKSVSAIANAVQAYESRGDANQLSEAMGDRHKVRSFYNNILDPNSKNGDVTIDTHAVGAAWLTPTTSEDVSVYHALNTTPLKVDQPEGWVAAKGSAVSGVKGTYGFYAQAYRDAAAKLHIQPRQLQSVVWEAKQRLFSKTQTGTKVKGAVDAVWRRYHAGEIGIDKARSEVVEAAEGSVG